MLKKLLFLIIGIVLCSGYQVKATHAVGADLTYECIGNKRYKVKFTFYRDCRGNTGAFPTETTNSINVNVRPSASCTSTPTCDTVVVPITDTVYDVNNPGCFDSLVINSCGGGQAVPVIGAITKGVVGGNTNNITFNHTVAAGNDRFLLLEVISVNGNSTGAMYGGTPMVFLNRQTGAYSGGTQVVEMYYLVAPPVGTAQIVVSFATNSGLTNDDRHARAINITGVIQTGTPWTSVSSGSGSACPVNYTIGSNTNNLVIDLFAVNWSAYDPIPAAGQTALYAADDVNTLDIYYRSSSKPGANPSVTMGWNWTNCAAQQWVRLGVSLRPATCVADTDTVPSYQCYRIDTVGWDTTVTNCVTPSPFTITLTKAFGTGQEVTPICPSSQSTCTGGTINGIREFVFEGILDLNGKGNCDDWSISYGIYARNNAITTLVTPGNDSLYVEAKLNSWFSPCNSSPYFSNKPVPFVCTGQKFCFNHGAIDIDGDSLAYKFIVPKIGPNSQVTYNPGYSATQPLKSNPPVSLDPMTGDICVTPTQTDVTVMAVLVEEYRNGVLIGSVIRDMQMNIINCNNTLPYLNGMNNTGDWDTSACAGNTICFDIPSFDPDGGQTVTMDWNQGIPGGTFNIVPGARPTGQFCWTPSGAEVSTIPYCFTVEVKDDNCPLNGFQTYSFCILVGGAAVDLGPDTAACSAGNVILDAGSGGAIPYTYTWSTGATSQTINVSTTGQYWVVVSDGVCNAIDTVNVGIGYPNVNLGPDNAKCDGDSIILNAGSGPYNYTWSTGATSQTIVVKNTGTYWVQVDSAGTCAKTDTVNLTFNPNPVASVNNDTLLCANDTLQLFVNGGTSWQWSPVNLLIPPVATNQNPLVSPPVTTTFTVVAYGTGGCTDTAQVTVTIDSSVAILNNDTVICVGDSVQLFGSGGGTYTWSGGPLSCTNCPDPWAKPDSTTTYKVVAQYVSGCQSESEITVQVHPPVNINAAPDSTLCQGDSVQLNASGGGTYQWSPAGSLNNPNIANPIATPSGTTTYIVQVTDPNTSCKNTDTVTVSIDTLPAVSVSGNTAICSIDSTTLTANPAGYNYQWSTGATTPSITVNPGTTATYTVTVTNGVCTDIDSATVTVTQQPVATIGGTAAICSGDSTTLTANPSGLTYQWNTGATTQTITVSPGADSTYTVTVTNGTCSDDTTFTVTVTPEPVANIAGNDSICGGYTAQLIASGGTNYLWTPGGFTTPTISVTPSGTTTYTVEVSNGSCRDSAQYTVTVTNVPNATISANNVNLCSGWSSTLTANPSGLTYLWNTGAATPSITVTPSGTTTYTVTVSDQDCDTTATITVNVTTQPTPTMNGDSLICGGNTATLNASGGTTYLWNPGGFTTPSITVTPAATTTYTVTVSNGSCDSTGQFTVNVTPTPVADAGPDVLICEGGNHQLNGSGGSDITWYIGTNVLCPSPCTTQPVVSPSANTTYILKAGNNNGQCEDTDTITVSVNKPPMADITGKPEICQDRDFTITFVGTTGNYTYTWNFGGANVVSGSGTGPYVVQWPDPGKMIVTVTVTDNVCPSSIDTIEVTVNDCPPKPDNIKPPGQPYWIVKKVENYPGTKVRIYDRWGLLIYESDDYKNNWDGTNKSGLFVPDGVYYYVIRYGLDGGEEAGFVHWYGGKR